LVIAAAGCIGFGVAAAFRKGGYFVYGLIRNPAQSTLLTTHEIIPVIGDVTDLNSFKEYIQGCPIIVDCSNLFGTDAPEKAPLALLKAIEEASKNQDQLLPPKTFIYTSGIMVYGHDTRIRDEKWPVSDTFYAQWRRKVEEAVTHSRDVNGIVLRPGWVFGGNGGPHGPQMFDCPDKLVLVGKNKERRYSWIHIDDLAAAYVAAGIKATSVRGMIFNIVNGYDNPVFADLVLQGTRLDGYKGEVEWNENVTDWHDILVDASVILSPLLAMNHLGWKPNILGLLDHLPFYYQTYKAFTKK